MKNSENSETFDNLVISGKRKGENMWLLFTPISILLYPFLSKQKALVLI